MDEAKKEDTVLPNQEQIASRRISLEEAGVLQSKRSSWTCHYCNRRMKSEAVFLRHHCPEKRKAEEIRSPLGQAALGYYNEWMRLRRYSQQSSSTFLSSRYYRQMMKFAQLVVDANIPNPEKYIELMVSGDVQPALWCANGAYRLYLEWMDSVADPLDQVRDSIETLIDIAEKEGVELSNIFTHLGSQRTLSLITKRKLSPWFCFNSGKFGEMFHSITADERRAYGIAVNSAVWAERFAKSQTVLNNVKDIISGIGL